MPGNSQEKTQEIKDDLYVFIDLFVKVFRIVRVESVEGENSSDGRYYENPRLLLTFLVLLVLTSTSSILKTLQKTQIAKIRYILKEDEHLFSQIEQILVKQGSEEDIALEMSKLLEQPPITAKIVAGERNDFSEFMRIVARSPSLDKVADVLASINRLVEYKCGTYLSPSAVVIQEGVIGFINQSVDLFKSSRIFYGKKFCSHSEENLLKRIEEARGKYFIRENSRIEDNRYQSSFWFVLLATGRKVERTFKFFFKEGYFSTEYLQKIRKILS